MNKYIITGIIIGVLAILSIIGNLFYQEKPSTSIESEDLEEKKDLAQIPKTSPPSIQPAKPSCDASYPSVCITPYPPDLDCDEIPHKDFRVIGEDKHGFDRDNDGIGCES